MNTANQVVEMFNHRNARPCISMGYDHIIRNATEYQNVSEPNPPLHLS